MSDAPSTLVPRSIPSGHVARGVVTVPGSKSIAQRALVLGALAGGTTTLLDAPRNRDLETMVAALRALGVPIVEEGTTLRVAGTEGALPPDARSVDAGENGTALRCLLAVAALRTDGTTVDGAAHRPVGPLLDALRFLGSSIETSDGGPPYRVRGPIHGGSVSVDGEISSQFATALALVAPLLPGGLHVVTPCVVSNSYIELTHSVLRTFGGIPRVERLGFSVEGGGLRGATLRIEPDASAAAFPLAAAAVTRGDVTVQALPMDSVQGDVRIAEFLARMGCRVWGSDGNIRVHGGALRPLEADCGKTPDLVPPLAAVAAFAEGTSRLSGVGHLRHKESDRIAVLVRGLTALGICARDEEGTLVIEGRGSPPDGPAVTLDPAGDHRMAMAFSILGLRRQGVRIADPGCVAKSDPDYWTRLESLVRPE